MPFQSGLRFEMLMCRIIVDEQVELWRGRRPAVDLAEEADEFLVLVVGHTLANGRASHRRSAASSVGVSWRL